MHERARATRVVNIDVRLFFSFFSFYFDFTSRQLPGVISDTRK